MAVVDGNDVFLSECKFDIINEFVGNYALTGKGSKKSEYAIIDKSGKLLNGEFSFSVSDPNYDGVKETFKCNIIFKNGKLNGKFISYFMNGKKHSEVSFKLGNFVIHSFSVYNKDGSLLSTDVNEEYGNLSELENELLISISEPYYMLFINSFDDLLKNKVTMPTLNQKRKEKPGQCPKF